MAAENKKTKRLYLEEQMSHKSNNLDLMKFLAAWLVIVHHSFDLNVSNGEWIKVITGGQLDFGTMAAVVVLSIIMGAFITTLSPGAYVSNSITWRYLLNAVFVLQHGLPGVFEHNVYGSAVNGALWTLPVEVACYVACFIVYKLGLLKKKRIIGVMALYLVCAVAGYRICTMFGIGLLISAFRPIYFFLLGHVLYVYRDRVPVDWRLFVLSLAGMAVCFALSWSTAAVWIFYPYVLLYPAFMARQCGSRLAFGGRFSYTIYLCAFPIQQLLIHLFGGQMNVYLHMGLALVIATAVGVVLHYTTEK